MYWYEGCTGLKTGFTTAAMYCLSATAERDGVEYIAVIMHGETIDARNTDATTLLNYAFANYSLCSLRPEGGLPALPVDLGTAETVEIRVQGETTALVPKGSAAPEYRLELPDRVPAPVQAGQDLGKLRVLSGGEELACLSLTAAEAVPRLDFWGLFKRLAGSLVGM